MDIADGAVFYCDHVSIRRVAFIAAINIPEIAVVYCDRIIIRAGTVDYLAIICRSAPKDVPACGVPDFYGIMGSHTGIAVGLAAVKGKL